MTGIQLPEPTWWLTHDVLTKRNRIDRMPIQSLQPGVMQHTAMYTADEVAAHLRALDASHQRLKKAMTQVLKHFPTDDDMVIAGWTPSEVEEACTAYDIGRAALEQAKDLS